MSKETVITRCACGCGAIVTSSRTNAIYASPACRQRALRKRHKLEAKRAALTPYFREGLSGIENRFSGQGDMLRERIDRFVESHSVDECDDLMRMIWQSICLEWEMK